MTELDLDSQMTIAQTQLHKTQFKSLTEVNKSSKSKATETTKQEEEAATQFESLLINEMLKSMWATLPKDGLLTGSKEEATYRDMLNQGIADQIAKDRSIGIKDVLIKDLRSLQKKASRASNEASKF